MWIFKFLFCLGSVFHVIIFIWKFVLFWGVRYALGGFQIPYFKNHEETTKRTINCQKTTKKTPILAKKVQTWPPYLVVIHFTEAENDEATVFLRTEGSVLAWNDSQHFR